MKTLLVIACASALGSCAHSAPRQSAASVVAHATLDPKSGASLRGHASVWEAGAAVTLRLAVSAATPGAHAVHLHVIGDCSSPDGESAGGHWNPTRQVHGQFDATPHHLGDVANLKVEPDGTGVLTFTTRRWSIGTGRADDVVGKAVVVHMAQDDFSSQPSGNAGARVACGVLRAGG